MDCSLLRVKVPQSLFMKRDLLFCCTALAGLLVGCSDPKPQANRSQEVPVETVAVARQSVPYKLDAVGTVEPLSSVQVKPKVGGEVEKVEFAEGAYVEAGQELFRIDPRPYDAALHRAEANARAAEVQAENAREKAERYTALSGKGATSKEEYQQFESDAKALAAQLAARQAELEEVRLQKEWTSVRAPISGRAGSILVKAGNIVQANSDLLVVLNQMKPIYITFALPELSLSEVRERQAQAPLRTIAKDPSSGEVLAEGTLTFIDNTVDVQSGMVTVKASFANSDEALWPGQFVDVEVVLGEQTDALVVPSVAVLESQQGPRVLVVKDSVAELREVTVERTYEDLSIIGSGVEAGEMVITAGQLRVTPGARVAVQNQAQDTGNETASR
jgi:multidrug efflux system membrane fusion protein